MPIPTQGGRRTKAIGRLSEVPEAIVLAVDKEQPGYTPASTSTQMNRLVRSGAFAVGELLSPPTRPRLTPVTTTALSFKVSLDAAGGIEIPFAPQLASFNG
jgi:hypothetical protein